MTEERTEEYWALLGQLSHDLSERTDAAVRDRVILRDAVCAFVAAERARGTPLKSVIRTVQRVLRNAEENAATATDELARQLMDWCREFHGPLAGVTS